MTLRSCTLVVGLLVVLATCRTLEANGPGFSVEGVRVLDGGLLDVAWSDGGYDTVAAGDYRPPYCDPERNPRLSLADAAKEQAPSGSIQIRCTVLGNGFMSDCAVLDGLGGEVDSKALETIGSWRCAPAKVQGSVVRANYVVTLNVAHGRASAPSDAPVLPAVGALPPAPSGWPDAKVPATNPLTPEKAELGALLFADPSFSADAKGACAGCHRPETGYASEGVVELPVAGEKRSLNVTSLLNVGWAEAWGAAGQWPSLEEAVLGHGQDLGADWNKAASVLAQQPAMKAAFARAFAGKEPSRQAIAEALASFLRTVTSSRSAYERWAREKTALPKDAEAGRLVFEKAGCSTCHLGPRLSDDALHAPAEGTFKVRTLPLQGVTKTGPWLRSGSAKTLDEVVTLMAQKPAAKAELKTKAVKLSTKELGQLKAFLEAQTGEVHAMPPLRLP